MSLGAHPLLRALFAEEKEQINFVVLCHPHLPKPQLESPLTCGSVLAAIKVKWPLGPAQSHLYLQHLQIKQLLLILTAPSVAKTSFPKEQVEKRQRMVTEHSSLGRGWRPCQDRGVSWCCGHRCPTHSGFKCGCCLFSGQRNLLNPSHLINTMMEENRTWSFIPRACRNPRRSHMRKFLYF